ncbi:carbohydrate esterase [Sphingobacteriaceae bacterium]|nr:carbohydrate esterase [Sphingobacteriaceae bacterium]
MKSKFRTALILSLIFSEFVAQTNSTFKLFPQNKSQNVNPDCHLVLTFQEDVRLGKSGKIKIYDASDNKLVDSLDVSIPAGPTLKDTTRVLYSPKPYEYLKGNFTNANTKPGTPSGLALPNSGNYQLTIIGGFTDAFHFHPVIIHNQVATIYPHNNLLQYNKTYYVTIDPEVFAVRDFKGIQKFAWTFSTKKEAPKKGQAYLVVNTNGTNDFNTVQGALDFVPYGEHKNVTILIKNGTYEELVYVRKKSNITLVGEDREKTIVTYTNYEAFNAHPKNLATNELPGTFPSRRGAFTVDNCNDISVTNLSIKNPSDQQAEGLLITGERNMLYHVNIRGGGDALQVNGSAYFKECKIEGGGDMILGRGAAFFDHCELYSKYTFMWIRNTAANHGNVFVNCTFKGIGTKPTDLAREPDNKEKTYPYSEAVLINCTLENIIPQGWGQIDGATENIHYWECNSISPDGKPVDISQRHPVSRQLTKEKDAITITNYSTPSYVLGGWEPAVERLIKLGK